jgi:YihY family inner membrane protein
MDLQRPLRWLDQRQRRYRALGLPIAVVKKYGDDQGGTLAAQLTYYGVLSLFPILLVTVTSLGFVLDGRPGLQHDLVHSVLRDFPVIGTQLGKNVHALSGNGWALAVGLAGLVWGSLGVAQAAQHAAAEAWNTPSRVRPNFVTRLVRSLALLATLGIGTALTTAFGAFGTVASSGAVLDVAAIVFALVLNIGLYLAAFAIVVPERRPLRELLPGAVFGGVAWSVVQTFGNYLVTRQLRNTSEIYGFFAIVLGLLWWLYLAAQIFVYANEVSVVAARRLWPRSLVQPPLTDADRETLVRLAKQEERRPEEHIDVDFDARAQGRRSEHPV